MRADGYFVRDDNLAGRERDRKRYEDAEMLHREVIERASLSFAPERPERGLFLAGFARKLQAQKRYAESADTFEQARAILVAAYGATHARVVKLDQMLVALYEEWGRQLPQK